jgi:hypothetical protein
MCFFCDSQLGNLWLYEMKIFITWEIVINIFSKTRQYLIFETKINNAVWFVSSRGTCFELTIFSSTRRVSISANPMHNSRNKKNHIFSGVVSPRGIFVCVWIFFCDSPFERNALLYVLVTLVSNFQNRKSRKFSWSYLSKRTIFLLTIFLQCVICGTRAGVQVVWLIFEMKRSIILPGFSRQEEHDFSLPIFSTMHCWEKQDWANMVRSDQKVTQPIPDTCSICETNKLQ